MNAAPDDPPPLTDQQHGDALTAMLVRHCNQLSEHFASVQIITTRLASDGGTIRNCQGSGDVWARVGACRRWVREIERL